MSDDLDDAEPERVVPLRASRHAAVVPVIEGLTAVEARLLRLFLTHRSVSKAAAQAGVDEAEVQVVLARPQIASELARYGNIKHLELWAQALHRMHRILETDDVKLAPTQLRLFELLNKSLSAPEEQAPPQVPENTFDAVLKLLPRLVQLQEALNVRDRHRREVDASRIERTASATDASGQACGADDVKLDETDADT